MKVFLSWSGSSSHAVAKELYKWLPMVIQRIEPYISSEIDKGTRWSTDIARELETSSFGIACVTEANKDAPWLLFEAGALSKFVVEGRLAPLLCGIEQSDIQKSPLTQFQMTKFERSEFLLLMQSINGALGSDALDSTVLDGLFNALWPSLSAAVSEALLTGDEPQSVTVKPLDTDHIMGAIEELVTSSRATMQMLSRPDKLLPPHYLRDIVRGYEDPNQHHMSGTEYAKIMDLCNKVYSCLNNITSEDSSDLSFIRIGLDGISELVSIVRGDNRTQSPHAAWMRAGQVVNRSDGDSPTGVAV